MKFRYGNFAHPDNEVNLTSLEVVHRQSQRGMRETTLYRLHLHGDLLYTGQAELNTRIAELIAAYSDDQMGDAGLYHDDGTPTRHRLEQNHANNLTGVRVAYRSWPKGEPDEYATNRSYYIILESEYRDPESEITAFHETLAFQGTCDNLWHMARRTVGQWVPKPYSQWSAQHIIQKGMVVGLSGWPLVRVPAPLYPEKEHRDRRHFTYDGPTFHGRGFTHYTVQWVYEMESAVQVGGLPAQY